MKPIHIAYAEDHIRLRTITCELLKEKGFIVSVFDDGKEMIKQLCNMPELPDVCIININMPHLDGFETIRHIRKDFSLVKVLVYSMSDYDTDIIKILSHGANGYLIKNGNIEELCKAVIAVHEKGVYFDEAVSKIVLKYLRKTEE
jgi:two-component system invasion response regulator UvrY